MILENLTESDYIKKLTVLYVEDLEDTMNSLGYILGKRVKQLYTASNGKEGLEKYKKHSDKIDIVITDIRMPFMNGIEMVKEIKEINEHVKIVYVSAQNDSNILVQCINVGADGFIIKPVAVKTRLISRLFQLSKEIYADKMIEQYNKTLKLILDCVDNIIILSNGTKILEANETFLDFFGESTLETFRKKYNCICDKFIKEDGFLQKDYPDNKTWIDIANTEKNPKVKIKDIHDQIETFAVQVNPVFINDDDVIYVIEFTNIDSLIEKK
jgi:YesN/AraC family two-component response regulator